ncbi:MAG: M61 family metallopeptidase [Saprospiraceae bacterium]|nr:M61 family metallopeptidase [Saprospiraceae bacterium]
MKKIVMPAPMQLIGLFWLCQACTAISQNNQPKINYTISIPNPASHSYHIRLETSGWNADELTLKLPQWMPGYYQVMHYAKGLENISAKNHSGKSVSLEKSNENTFIIKGIRQSKLSIEYDMKTDRQFVANSYVDSSRAYIIPANTFLYPDGYIQLPVSVKIDLPARWNKIATGLDPVNAKTNEYTASDFDILYDCPILIGDLEELPSFKVKGIEHRFIGYHLGQFDRTLFMDKLNKVVASAINIIGDIPYKQYTFIAIGPGRGGIEHLNNTSFGFDGSQLNTPEAVTRVLNFLAHEYFHHYNVKRIRPFELGPFDYDQGSRTNLLWVSEGLSVYYEYMIVKRAGLVDEETLLAEFSKNLNTVENNQGRHFQSLAQASYNTWQDGPFGTQREEKGKTISYYDKGPLVGLLLDLEIRHATQNKKSLDDVMQQLYWNYYKTKHRGFTDAEFQQTCESVAETSLAKIFEYVHTTQELDYKTYLNYAGLTVEDASEPTSDKTSKKNLRIVRQNQLDDGQTALLKSWLKE